jgi:RsiW-degrading membrane proteinase PrsW (M82 family)
LSRNILLYLQGVGFVFGGALFWLIYFDLKDRYQREPRRLLIMAFILGNLAAILALGFYTFAEKIGLPAFPSRNINEIILYCFLLVGPIEEGSKFFIARSFVFRWKHFDEPIDGMVYAACVAIGFAGLENILYLPQLDLIQQLARVITSPLTHSLFAAVWGFGVSKAFFGERRRIGRILWQTATLLLSMFLHGLYDFFLFAYGATYLASVIVLVLWVFLIIYARRLLQAQKSKINQE